MEEVKRRDLTQIVIEDQKRQKMDEIQSAVIDLAQIKVQAKADDAIDLKPKKTSWLEKIRREQLDRDKKVDDIKEKRAQRLKAIMDSDSEENDENKFDYQGLAGNKLKDFLSKIEEHVHAEQMILDAWAEKDLANGKK